MTTTSIDGEDQQIDDDRERTARDRGVGRGSLLGRHGRVRPALRLAPAAPRRACARGPATSPRSSARSSERARGCSARTRGTSGVARRTASGGRGGDACVMSGTSSGIGAPNSGSSATPARPARGDPAVGAPKHALEIGAGVGRRGRRRGHRASTSDRSSSGLTACGRRAERQIRGRRRPAASEKSYPQLRQRSTCSNPR